MSRKHQPSSPQPGSTITGSGPVLALDLGQNTGWALRDGAGQIISGTQRFKPGRFEGGGMPLLRFVAWLNELQRAVGPLGGVFLKR